MRVLATGAWQLWMVALGSYEFLYDIRYSHLGCGGRGYYHQEAGGKVTDFGGKKIG